MSFQYLLLHEQSPCQLSFLFVQSDLQRSLLLRMQWLFPVFCDQKLISPFSLFYLIILLFFLFGHNIFYDLQTSSILISFLFFSSYLFFMIFFLVLQKVVYLDYTIFTYTLSLLYESLIDLILETLFWYILVRLRLLSHCCLITFILFLSKDRLISCYLYICRTLFSLRLL